MMGTRVHGLARELMSVADSDNFSVMTSATGDDFVAGDDVEFASMLRNLSDEPAPLSTDTPPFAGSSSDLHSSKKWQTGKSEFLPGDWSTLTVDREETSSTPGGTFYNNSDEQSSWLRNTAQPKLHSYHLAVVEEDSTNATALIPSVPNSGPNDPIVTGNWSTQVEQHPQQRLYTNSPRLPHNDRPTTVEAEQQLTSEVVRSIAHVVPRSAAKSKTSPAPEFDLRNRPASLSTTKATDSSEVPSGLTGRLHSTVARSDYAPRLFGEESAIPEIAKSLKALDSNSPRPGVTSSRSAPGEITISELVSIGLDPATRVSKDLAKFTAEISDKHNSSLERDVPEDSSTAIPSSFSSSKSVVEKTSDFGSAILSSRFQNNSAEPSREHPVAEKKVVPLNGEPKGSLPQHQVTNAFTETNKVHISFAVGKSYLPHEQATHQTREEPPRLPSELFTGVQSEMAIAQAKITAGAVRRNSSALGNEESADRLSNSTRAAKRPSSTVKNARIPVSSGVSNSPVPRQQDFQGRQLGKVASVRKTLGNPISEQGRATPGTIRIGASVDRVANDLPRSRNGGEDRTNVRKAAADHTVNAKIDSWKYLNKTNLTLTNIPATSENVVPTASSLGVKLSEKLESDSSASFRIEGGSAKASDSSRQGGRPTSVAKNDDQKNDHGTPGAHYMRHIVAGDSAGASRTSSHEEAQSARGEAVLAATAIGRSSNDEPIATNGSALRSLSLAATTYLNGRENRATAPTSSRLPLGENAEDLVGSKEPSTTSVEALAIASESSQKPADASNLIDKEPGVSGLVSAFEFKRNATAGAIASKKTAPASVSDTSPVGVNAGDSPEYTALTPIAKITSQGRVGEARIAQDSSTPSGRPAHMDDAIDRVLISHSGNDLKAAVQIRLTPPGLTAAKLYQQTASAIQPSPELSFQLEARPASKDNPTTRTITKGRPESALNTRIANIEGGPMAVPVAGNIRVTSVEDTRTTDSGRSANLKIDLGEGQTAQATVRERAGTIDVKIVTSSTEAAQRVANEIDSMRRGFDSAGLHLGHSEVTYQNENGGRGNRDSFYQQESHQAKNNSHDETFIMNEVPQ